MHAQTADDLYLSFRDLLLSRAGLHYPERRRADLLHGLDMAVAAGGYSSVAALYADAHRGGRAWDLVIEHLTIGETYFFRNGPQFDALRAQIIPDLMQRHAATRAIRIWSAGCATGEEPYSLAMAIGDLLRGQPAWDVNIQATDINPQFLSRAREALYGEWSFRETPAEMRARFFQQEQGRWRLRPEIRRMVHFSRLNLAEPSYPSIVTGICAIDLLICRNVTIYFDEATTRQVVDRFYRTLLPGGWLIVGHSEPQASVYSQFEVHNFPNTVVYRKPLDAPMFTFGLQQRAAPARAEAPPPIAPAPPMRAQIAPQGRVAGQPAAAAAQPAIAAPQPAPPAPTQPIALVREGRACADRGNWAMAEERCDQALRADPLCIEAHYLLAQIYEHQGRLDQALVVYRRTVYLDQRFVPGLIGMGNVWRQIGRAREAHRSYEAALAQLSQLPGHAPVAGVEGATAAELTALVRRLLG